MSDLQRKEHIGDFTAQLCMVAMLQLQSRTNLMDHLHRDRKKFLFPLSFMSMLAAYFLNTIFDNGTSSICLQTPRSYMHHYIGVGGGARGRKFRRKRVKFRRMDS